MQFIVGFFSHVLEQLFFRTAPNDFLFRVTQKRREDFSKTWTLPTTNNDITLTVVQMLNILTTVQITLNNDIHNRIQLQENLHNFSSTKGDFR